MQNTQYRGFTIENKALVVNGTPIPDITVGVTDDQVTLALRGELGTQPNTITVPTTDLETWVPFLFAFSKNCSGSTGS